MNEFPLSICHIYRKGTWKGLSLGYGIFDGRNRSRFLLNLTGEKGKQESALQPCWSRLDRSEVLIVTWPLKDSESGYTSGHTTSIDLLHRHWVIHTISQTAWAGATTKTANVSSAAACQQTAVDRILRQYLIVRCDLTAARCCYQVYSLQSTLNMISLMLSWSYYH